MSVKTTIKLMAGMAVEVSARLTNEGKVTVAYAQGYAAATKSHVDDLDRILRKLESEEAEQAEHEKILYPTFFDIDETEQVLLDIAAQNRAIWRGNMRELGIDR